MAKEDVLDLILGEDNEYHPGVNRIKRGGYFTSVHLDDDDSLRVTLDYGNRTETYKVTVEETID